MSSFRFIAQSNIMDCGPACLCMVAAYHGKKVNLDVARCYTGYNRQGVSLLDIAEAAKKMGFHAKGVVLTYAEIIHETALPAILHWRNNHFVVLPPQNFKRKTVVIADPSDSSVIRISKNDFMLNWKQPGTESEGIALLIELTPAFSRESLSVSKKRKGIRLWNYVNGYKKYFFKLLISLLAASLLQLIFPFLAQSIVDKGILPKDIGFVYIVLLSQLALLTGRIMIEFIRGRVLLFISTRINFSLLSDFWTKLMKLPLDFFETRRTGDILQRIYDHNRIEQFLTGSVLGTLFSFVNLLIFSVIMFDYSKKIFFIFIAGSILYFLWIKIFLRQRRLLNYRNFALASLEKNTTLQLVNGMREIKLNNAEVLKKKEWEDVQVSLFGIGVKNLSLSQYQQAGSFFINESKNIVISFLTAGEVISGNLTLGSMLAIQYIIGQLNSPVDQMIGFIQSAQDAKISIERLNEIYQLREEDAGLHKPNQFTKTGLLHSSSIKLLDLSFAYPGSGGTALFNKLNLNIPAGRTTAIVGVSGSGKTTLLKLLLRFYEDYDGDITVGDTSLRTIPHRFWRNQCGAVMQDGYIFNDSFKRNIAVSEEFPDIEKLIKACRVANILSFIESFPSGFDAMIGDDGNGISEGQKQRILIARAVYKDPEYIFFDEATSSLDTGNENIIMKNLREFCKDRTVVIVAHRLSTVMNADKIVVLNKGCIVEEGTHQELVTRKGKYYELVRNQLELGKQ